MRNDHRVLEKVICSKTPLFAQVLVQYERGRTREGGLRVDPRQLNEAKIDFSSSILEVVSYFRFLWIIQQRSSKIDVETSGEDGVEAHEIFSN